MRIPKLKIELIIDKHEDKEGEFFDGYIVDLTVTDMEQEGIFSVSIVDRYIRGDNSSLKSEIEKLVDEVFENGEFTGILDRD